AGDLVIAVFALSLAAFLQYLPNTSLMIWFVQTPFILYAGQKYKDVVLRYLGYAMAWLCLMRFVFVFDWNNAAAQMADVTFTASHVTALVGCAAMAGCYGISRKGRERFLDIFDLGTVFCAAAIFYLTACVWSLTQGPWLYLFLLLEVPVLLWTGRMIKEKVPAAAAHALTWLAVLMPVFSVSSRSAVVDFTFLGQTSNSWEWTYFFGSIAMGVSFWLVRPEAREAARRDEVHVDDHVYSAFAALLMNLWLWAVLDGKWLTTGLTIEAVVLINAALLFTLKRLRVYGYLVLVAVMFRYILIDDYIGAGALKWLLILLELGTFFGLYLVSFFKKEENDRVVQLDEIETNGLFAGFMVMFVTTVFEHFAWSWRSLGLGGGAVALIVLGLRTRDKVARIGGFLLLGVTLLRIVFVDLARLTTIYKIISFIVIGALLLGLSFLYNKYFV
ncbi:MAG: DUF2339 domain-containing protein, partial [Candidatus Omnitrophica bacterium]|nr:DUF2339 domain-containing protein [Candidatus Omnitrophota bacterium]